MLHDWPLLPRLVQLSSLRWALGWIEERLSVAKENVLERKHKFYRSKKPNPLLKAMEFVIQMRG